MGSQNVMAGSDYGSNISGSELNQMTNKENRNIVSFLQVRPCLL